MWLLLLRWFSGCVAAAVAFAARHLHCPKEVFIVDRFSICPRLPVNIIRQPQDLLARPRGAQDHLLILWWQRGKDQGKIKLWTQHQAQSSCPYINRDHLRLKSTAFRGAFPCTSACLSPEVLSNAAPVAAAIPQGFCCSPAVGVAPRGLQDWLRHVHCWRIILADREHHSFTGLGRHKTLLIMWVKWHKYQTADLQHWSVPEQCVPPRGCVRSVTQREHGALIQSSWTWFPFPAWKEVFQGNAELC